MQSVPVRSLAAAFRGCFLRLQKATLGRTSGRCKDVLGHHGIWLWRSVTFGSWAASYEGKSQCAVPVSCRTPDSREAVVALNKRYCRQWGWCILSTVRDTFAKQTVSVSQTNFRAGSQHKWTVFAIETRYQDLQMDHHIYMFICRDIFRYIDSDKSWIMRTKKKECLCKTNHVDSGPMSSVHPNQARGCPDQGGLQNVWLQTRSAAKLPGLLMIN